jgi:hypothetical protein
VKPILIKHRSGESRLSKGYLVDATHVIYSDGVYVSLFEAVPAIEPDIYTEAYDYGHIIVAKGGRTQSSMEKIIQKLNTMSAYTLLTEHFDANDQLFFVNKHVRRLGMR